MPHRLNEFRAKIQFVAHAAMPHQIYQACLKTGKPSNTVYIQHAVCEALARDLDLDLDALLAGLPPPRGPAARTPQHQLRAIGPANTIEEVR